MAEIIWRSQQWGFDSSPGLEGAREVLSWNGPGVFLKAVCHTPESIVQILDAARTTALNAGSLVVLFPAEDDTCNNRVDAA